MEFSTKQTITNKNVVAAGNNNRIHQIHAGSVTGLDIGHVVLVTAAGIQGRWDGTTTPSTPHRLAIITAKQMTGDSSVSALVKGNYVRQHAVLDDDSALPAAAQFTLTLSDLWDEGEW
ncbi:hypothetical protein [Vibrio sp. OPT18]|uniref:hypothetical protein n=1 Tax=Vibrio sp. OPT18 TaxID=2778641 RepID=UPI001882EF79|nr:hypothetical protein [Vibrio sp. OPT18]MBE8578645.1 hypothetical protein [Vibrio sp. OPT18]